MHVCSGSVSYLCELTRHIKVVPLVVVLPPTLISLRISRGADTKQGLVVLDNSPDCAPGRRSSCRVVLVPCAARTLTKTSRLQLSLRVLNFSISRPRSNMKPMIEPIGWLRTLQFVATNACVREDECVRAPLLFLYNVLNSEYKCMWVAST